MSRRRGVGLGGRISGFSLGSAVLFVFWGFVVSNVVVIFHVGVFESRARRRNQTSAGGVVSNRSRRGTFNHSTAGCVTGVWWSTWTNH